MTDLKYESGFEDSKDNLSDEEMDSKQNKNYTIKEKLIASSLDSSSSETVLHDFTRSKLSKIFETDQLN